MKQRKAVRCGQLAALKLNPAGLHMFWQVQEEGAVQKRCARLSSYLDKLAKERGRHPSANFEELQQAHLELCGASCEIEQFCGMRL